MTLAPCSLCLPDPTADEDLARRVRRYLQTQQPTIARRVEVQSGGGAVTVEGIVRSFYERQLAVACIRRVAGVRHVVDLLVVMDEVRPLLGCRSAQREVLP